MQTGTNTTTITQTVGFESSRKSNRLQEIREGEKKTYDGSRGESFSRQVTGQEIIWTHVIAIVLLHVFAVNSFMSYMITTTKFQTTIWGEFHIYGPHRSIHKTLVLGIWINYVKKVYVGLVFHVAVGVNCKDVKDIKYCLSEILNYYVRVSARIQYYTVYM